MKINQVEELVGITKKNIRFYEDQGLLNPNRNPENGYREYHMQDVNRLYKIKLLRKLGVPIEEIRLLMEEKQTLSDCMENHLVYLEQEQHNIDIMKQMCMEISKSMKDFQTFEATDYLEEMENLEKCGAQFMNIEKRDIQKKKVGPIIAAIVCILFFVLTIAVVIWADIVAPMPWWFIGAIVGLCVIPIIGVTAALIMRLNEINGGEENEASKY